MPRRWAAVRDPRRPFWHALLPSHSRQRFEHTKLSSGIGFSFRLPFVARSRNRNCPSSANTGYRSREACLSTFPHFSSLSLLPLRPPPPGAVQLPTSLLVAAEPGQDQSSPHSTTTHYRRRDRTTTHSRIKRTKFTCCARASECPKLACWAWETPRQKFSFCSHFINPNLYLILSLHVAPARTGFWFDPILGRLADLPTDSRRRRLSLRHLPNS